MTDGDDAQTSNGQDGADTSAGASTTDADGANQNDQDTKQSSDGNNQEKLYELPDGRMVNGETLTREWEDNFMPDYTRKAQRIKEYEESAQRFGSDSGQTDSGQTSRRMSNDIAEEVPEDVREAVVSIMEPEIERRMDERFQQFSQTQQQTQEIERSFERLENTWNGDNGKPRFSDNDKKEVIDYMRETGTVFDPEIAYEQLHKDEINDWRVKQALKKQSGGRKSEDTGGSDSSKKPNRKSPKTLSEASKATLERLRNTI